MSEVLDRRALNRATLERQLLLRRTEMSVPEVVEHLVGLQAQTPHTWYVGLWARIAGFRPEEAGELLTCRRLVRMALMRGTIHLVTAEDCVGLRGLVQPVLDRWLETQHGKQLDGLDRRRLAEAAREILAERPLTFTALGRSLAEVFPGYEPGTLAQAVRGLVPLVQVPPRGVWRRSGPVAHTSVETWLGPIIRIAPSPHTMVLRYLAAFGPATVMDVQAWSGLTRLREIVDELRPQLVTFRDEQGRELFDLPDAPRPDPETPAPPRFLYDFDNLLLSHADRGRVVTDDVKRQAYDPHGPIPQLLLIDGFTNGDWTIAREKRAATLTIRPYVPLSDDTAAAVAEEGAGLLDVVAADAESRELRFAPPRVPGAITGTGR
jgi:Winged helix DNA-binding domain